MKVSIITVAFNSAATIGDTLRSVAAQTHRDIEHIVIDGGSSDGTLAQVREHGAHVAALLSEPDRGIYDAMNKGLALASGDVVGFLNSDDVFAKPESLSRVVAAFDGPVDACHADLLYVRADDLSRVVRYWRSGPYRPGACSRGWMPAHPTFYVRREQYLRHGAFDLDFRIAADFEMALRLLDVHGVRSTHVAEPLVRMRVGGASNRSLPNVLRANLEASRACRKHGFAGGPGFILRKVASRLPQFVRRPGGATG